MSLRTKFMLAIISIFFIFGAAEALILRFIVFESFKQLEQDEALKDIERVQKAIDREILHLGLLCQDWATWDEMYDFVNNVHEEFITSNLLLNSFKANNCNLIYIFDRSMNLVWGSIYDLDIGASFKINKSSPDFFPKKDKLFQSAFHLKSTDPLFMGRVIQTENGPMMIVCRPVTKSNNSSEYNGMLMMGRFLSKRTIDNLFDQTKVNFNIIYPVNNNNYKGMIPLHPDKNTQNDQYYLKHENGRIRIIKEYPDIEKIPAFQIETILPRDISERGLQTIYYTAGYIITSVLTTLVVFAFILQKNVFIPLNQMSLHMKKITDEGNFTLRLELKRKDEIGILGAVYDKMIDRISAQTTEIINKNKILEKISYIDELTQIYNRRAFNQHLDLEWKRMRRDSKPISLVICDIDFFKQFNDYYGHQAGDECLKKVAYILKGVIERPGDIVARYGGEEFTIVLSNTVTEGAVQVVGKLISELEAQMIPHAASEASPFVSMSFGISSVIPSVELNSNALLGMADKALYKAKSNGRNRYEIFRPQQ